MTNQPMIIFRTKACLAITGRIQGTSRERLYDKLGLHSLVKRLWRNKLVFFYKIVNRLLSDYLYSYLDFPSQENYVLRLSSASIIRPLPTITTIITIFSILYRDDSIITSR